MINLLMRLVCIAPNLFFAGSAKEADFPAQRLDGALSEKKTAERLLANHC